VKGAVKVRTFDEPKTTKVPSRVVIDLEDLETTDRFMLLNAEGGSLRIGMTRIDLDWQELRLLARTILTTDQRFAGKSPTRLG
jgi:hypothetical protein